MPNFKLDILIMRYGSRRSVVSENSITNKLIIQNNRYEALVKEVQKEIEIIERQIDLLQMLIEVYERRLIEK